MSTASCHPHHLNGISGLFLKDDNHDKHYQVKLAHILFHHHFCHIIWNGLMSCEPSTEIFMLLGNTVGTKILLCKINSCYFCLKRHTMSYQAFKLKCLSNIEDAKRYLYNSSNVLDSKRNATSHFQTIYILQPCIQKVGAQNCLHWIYTSPYHCNQVSTFI